MFRVNRLPILALTTVVALSTWQSAQADEKCCSAKRWKLAMQVYTFNRYTLFEALDKCKELGIKYVELYPGQELDKNEYDEIKKRTELLQVRVKALDLLAMRDHSAAELRLKLLQREFSEQYIDTVLTSLEGAGLLDDRRFAESWIRMRLRKNPCGRALLASGLAMKGVDRETAHRAIDALLDEETLQQALDAAADKLLRRKGMTREKLVRSLMRKGFRYSDVSDAAAARLQATPEHGGEGYYQDDF